MSKWWKISGIRSDDNIYDIALKEYEEAEGKPFFLECTKTLLKMPQFDPIIKPSILKLADNFVVSKGEVKTLLFPWDHP